MKLGTPFGRALRKLRIDRGETLADISESVGVTAAFMSAIETGKKNVSDELFTKITQHYQLKPGEARKLKDLANQSVTEIRISMRGRGDEDRNLVAVFARSFQDLTPAERKRMLNMLKQKEVNA